MRQYSRIFLAGGVCAVFLAAAGAVVQSGSDTDAKRSILRAGLEKRGVPSDDPVLLRAAERAQLLTDIAVDEGASPAVRIAVSGRPVYDTLILDGGRKLAVDLYNTLNPMSGSKLEPEKAAPIRAVRTSLYAFEPQFVSRVVIELAEPCAPRMTFEDGALRVVCAPVSGLEASPLRTAARDLGERLDAEARSVAVEQARLEERLARARDRHFALESSVDEAATACVVSLQGAKSTHLARSLARLTDPAGAEAAANDTESRLADVEARCHDVKARARELVARYDAAQQVLAAESRAHAEKINDRIRRDLEDLRSLEARLEDGAAEDDSARRVLEVLEGKQARLADDDRAPYAEWAERADALDATHRAELESLATELAEVHAVLDALGREAESRVQVAAAAPSKEGEPSLARLDAEFRKLKTALPAKASEPLKTEDAALAPAPAAIEAVQTAQVDLGLASLSPAATLSGALERLAPAMLTAQAESEAVSGEAPAGEASVLAVEIPAEPVASEEPAPEPAEAIPPPPAAPEPAPAPTRSVVVAAPIPVENVETAEPVEEVVGDASALYEPVNLDLREMDLSNFVALLARKAGINVIAGTELTGTVTASIKRVPLRQALEMVLRMHDLGLVEEEGVYRIIPYEQALVTKRTTEMVTLDNAGVEEIKLTLDAILQGEADRSVSVAANGATNVLVISGPPERVNQLVTLANALDVAEPVTPTVTEAIKLNYAEPDDVIQMVEGMLSTDVGNAAVDPRGRHLIVTDIPAVVEQVRALIQTIDIPVKQVAIESMIVDAVLSDSSETGTQWLLSIVRDRNTRGEIVGSLQDLDFGTNLGNVGTSALDAGLLSFNILSSDIDFQAAIAAEVSNSNAKILANPQIVIVENETGRISIVQEFPYQEITQTTQGPPVATTEFKPIGVTLDVSPRVTHLNDIIANISAKQSSVSGLTDTGVPIEDKREAETTLTVKDGQTIFIGGLRNHADRLEVSKVPVLGDVPVINFLFRNTRSEKTNTELMIFLTCHVLGIDLPELTPEEQAAYDELGATPRVPDSQRAMFRSMAKPGEMRDPAWKWRRAK